MTFTAVVSAATLHPPSSTFAYHPHQPPQAATPHPTHQLLSSSASTLPPSYSPISSSSSSSAPPAVPSPSQPTSLPPPPLPSTPSARLTDLCPSDKAKVGKLLLRVATLQAETERHSHTDQQLQAIQEEHSRLQQQKAEVEGRLDESMRLLKGYQDRLREMEEMRAQRRERRRARKDAEQMTDPVIHPPPPVQMKASQEDSGVGEGLVGGEEQEAVDSAHLHRLLHQQKVRIQQRMEELQRHAESYHTTAPASHPHHSPSHSSPSHPRDSLAPHPRGVEGRTNPSSSPPTRTPHTTASSTTSSYSAHSSSQSSHESHKPTRSPPVTVSVRYFKRTAAPPTSTASTIPPSRLSRNATSVSISSRPSPQSHPRHLPHSTPPPPRRLTHRVPPAWEREEEQTEEEEEEGADDAHHFSQSSSPVSRRIHRLLSIQSGSASLKTRTPPPPPRPRPVTRTQPPPAASKRPSPPHFSSSPASSAPRRSTHSVSLDAEMQAVVEALNSGDTSPPASPLPGRLRQYDERLLDTLSMLDV